MKKTITPKEAELTTYEGLTLYGPFVIRTWDDEERNAVNIIDRWIESFGPFEVCRINHSEYKLQIICEFELETRIYHYDGEYDQYVSFTKCPF